MPEWDQWDLQPVQVHYQIVQKHLGGSLILDLDSTVENVHYNYLACVPGCHFPLNDRRNLRMVDAF